MHDINHLEGKLDYVLIVEDSHVQAHALRSVLAQGSFEVAIVSNGVDALDLLAFRQPSLIISDVVMPEMDGYTLCQKLKESEEFKHVPFMLLTALAHPAEIFKGLESGADYYSVKPYDPIKLRDRVVSIIKQYREQAIPGHHTRHDFKFAYNGKAYQMNAGHRQIMDLLLATFDDVERKNKELEAVNQKLSDALRDVKMLRGLIPICSYCKKVRDDHGYWEQVESYISRHSQAQFSHGICPRCFDEYTTKLAPQIKLTTKNGQPLPLIDKGKTSA